VRTIVTGEATDRRARPDWAAGQVRMISVAAALAVAGATIAPLARPGYLEYAPFPTMSHWWPSYAPYALTALVAVVVLVVRAPLATGLLLGVLAWAPLAMVEASRVPPDGPGGRIAAASAWIGAALMLAAGALLFAVAVAQFLRAGVRAIRIPLALVIAVGAFVAVRLTAPMVLAGLADDGRARSAAIATAVVALAAIARWPSLFGAGVLGGTALATLLYAARDMLPSYSNGWPMDHPTWALAIGAAALLAAALLAWSERRAAAPRSRAAAPARA
jgi:hypothetical protein